MGNVGSAGELGLHLADDDVGVFLAVHVTGDFSAFFLAEVAFEFGLQEVVHLSFVLVRESGLDQHLEQFLNSGLDLTLHKSEFFVTFVPQNFPEHSDVVILPVELLDPVDDSSGPFDDQTLQTILSVQVGVHVLLHSFPRQFALNVLLVTLQFRLVNIVDQIDQLFVREHAEVARVAGSGWSGLFLVAKSAFELFAFDWADFAGDFSRSFFTVLENHLQIPLVFLLQISNLLVQLHLLHGPVFLLLLPVGQNFLIFGEQFFRALQSARSVLKSLLVSLSVVVVEFVGFRFDFEYDV